jgi:hypothetical protein
MNIFVLDKDPEMCAFYHNDKHVVKMILESTQLLSNCLPEDKAPYKRTHLKHPCTLWLQENILHQSWLWELAIWLCHEYTERYEGRKHKCQGVLWEMHDIPLWDGTMPDHFALAMPDEYKVDCPVQSYRNYYLGDKAYMCTWKPPSRQPDWFKV